GVRPVPGVISSMALSFQQYPGGKECGVRLVVATPRIYQWTRCARAGKGSGPQPSLACGWADRRRHRDRCLAEAVDLRFVGWHDRDTYTTSVWKVYRRQAFVRFRLSHGQAWQFPIVRQASGRPDT